MKSTALFLISILFFIVACHKKTIPVITERTTEPSAPVSQAVNVTPDIATGKTIYTNRCGRCHDLPDPVKYTSQRWDGILSTMIPRARLTKEQGVHVTAYVKANSK